MAAVLFLRAWFRILSKVDQRNFSSQVTFTEIYVFAFPILLGSIELFFIYLPFPQRSTTPWPTPVQLEFRVILSFRRDMADGWNLSFRRRYRWCDTGYLEPRHEVWKETPESRFDSVCHSDHPAGGGNHLRANIRKDAQD